MDSKSPGLNFERLVELNDFLRGPEGCPWDKCQDLDSIKKCFLSEVQELIQALDKKDFENILEECGDVIYNIIFIASLAQKDGKFNIADVLKNQHIKIKERHEHVFLGLHVDSPEEAEKEYKKAKFRQQKRSE